jgi:hypothetical protein
MAKTSLLAGVALLFVVFGFSTHVARADSLVRRDPNDTSGPLDVLRVAHAHGRKHSVLAHRIVTAGRWDESDLRNKNSYLYFWFSTDEDRYAEGRVAVESENEKLSVVYQDYEETSDGASVGPPTSLRFKRANGRSIEIFLPRRLLGVDAYRWSVETLYRRASTRCRFGRPLCLDRAPRGTGRGRIKHTLH